MTTCLPNSTAGIAHAASLLRVGRLVAFGTETVYGLGADATNDAALARVFAAKARPSFNPLICHYPSAASAFRHVAATDLARRLTNAFWPGPLTLVLPRRSSCPIGSRASAGLDTLAVRVPAHAGTRLLLSAVGRPVAAPSANRSGGVSPTTAAHVFTDLNGRIDGVLDFGASVVGIESTVLDLSGKRPTLLRSGGVTAEQIEALGIELALADGDASGGRLRSPGLLASHYAPRLAVRLDAESVGASEALLAFGPPLKGAALMEQLSLTADATEAAARLFGCLRDLDRAAVLAGLTTIAVMPIPGTGLGAAIRDRLTRAAAPR